MDFNSNSALGIYSNRKASNWWLDWAENNINPKSKIIADIGCGGGIYSEGFYKLGALEVIMVDGSKKYVQEAKNNLSQYNPTILFNDCTNLDIVSSYVDVVFQRALIHHLSTEQMLKNLKEINRILKSEGCAYIQDRTYQDILVNDEESWIRNTLFECYPRLLEYEKKRRPDSNIYEKLVQEANLKIIKISKVFEVRKEYLNIEELCEEILKRKGKSILFELSDSELSNYCERLKQKAINKKIIEQDIWSIWEIKKA